MDMVARVLPSSQEKAEELAKLITELSEKGHEDAILTILESFVEQKKAS